jgi:HK97 gp10 family phage protein
MQREVHRFLASWIADVKAQAVKNAPMVTGYLRSTIYGKVKDWVVDVGADATYALFVELGTRYMRAKPYLYPAIQQYLPELEAVIVSAIKQAKAEAGL